MALAFVPRQGWLGRFSPHFFKQWFLIVEHAQCHMVGIQDVFNVLGDAVALRGELSDVYDFTIFELPRVRAQGAISHVLAGIGFPGVAQAISSHCSMTQSHCGVEHGCTVDLLYLLWYFSMVNYHLYAAVFSRHCTCKVTLQGPQSVVFRENNCRKFKKSVITGAH
jgi:hypothetical protein